VIERSQAVRDAVAVELETIVDLTETITQIPAPTFEEAARATFVRERFIAAGMQPWDDDAGNVYARIPGSGGGTILLSAHLDTVFPAGTDLQVRRAEGRMEAPGVGDNSLSVATLLQIPPLLARAGIQTAADVLLCANTGEEGLGDLRGIRAAIDGHGHELVAAIALEGHGLGRIVNRAVGSRRLRVTVEGPGGHSWGAFGRPSAIHELAEIISRITRLPVSDSPKTTFNVGLVEGGISVNTIAPTASFTLDLRSEQPSALAALAEQVDHILSEADAPACEVRVRSEVLGERPAGAIDDDASIVHIAMQVLQALEIEPYLAASSTDANIPIAAGIPAISIGLTTGGNAHRESEYIDLEPLAAGVEQLVLLVQHLDMGEIR
jgi:acetylornithine deacetylase/succinyl-diaminopimelate desuccinylase-like protein